VLSSRVYDRAFDVFRNLEGFRDGSLWRLALNVSATQLQDGELTRRLQELGARHGVPPEEIDLEVPAPIVFGAAHDALARLRSLRELGYRVVVDDFAAHRDEIDRLEGMPIDVLKIHPRWTTSLDDDLARRRVASIVATAGRLGLGVIAEGVESAEQGRALADAGVEAVQGFAVAPPMHAAALLAWLATRPVAG
jgi:EAL domain-containing protein (putative c-di-GMP-specific phosphodiesterase class I)